MAEATTSTARRASDIPQKERFFRYFQQEITDLQEQMGRLGNMAVTGGERGDAIDHLVAGIARLGSEVNDASGYLPAYDQKTYGEAIKGLREKLDETRASFGPRTTFTFKTARKNPSAVSLSDVVELAAQKRQNLLGYQTPSTESSFVNSPNYLQTPERSSSPAQPPVPPPTAVDQSSKDAWENEMKEKASPGPRSAAIRRPTFSTSSTVSITHESNAHIILPSSASHASKPCSLTSLKSCAVDISVLSPQDGAPFAGLTVKNVKGSLLVCGIVSGPAHITGVEDSVMVVTCRQFRMHECKNVDVYLSCSSRPIIEDCSGIGFAQLPDTYRIPSATPPPNEPLKDTTNTAPNPTSDVAAPSKPASPADLWSQIDDFKWLKSTPSPNWSLLPPEDTVTDDAWREVVPGGPGWSLEDILKATRVLK
ncbi:hypothetical protein EPUS_03098 [Endocarpon pusillum Z07020]|uniref:C-CAP/cofactor C-like domain-containing protein n=1 Tax=Endocarpon pusillum (strain Z07020 / HMAS-L-300199) TaxID=1263415 RepID=U1GMY0_ENDPU|nr:uncharacterized protein EPUS_03098 [Endocarpon pusillum Z07020]ERF73266.1 hypothetical protein EPUS_03098 [Endocarpon pusillum Z07020]